LPRHRIVRKRHAALTPVVRLFLARSPSTVARFIISIVVDAIQSQSFRLLSHVGNEIHKVMPSLAHFDPTSAVIRVVGRARIFTSRNHSRPALVRRSTGVPMPESVLVADAPVFTHLKRFGGKALDPSPRTRVKFHLRSSHRLRPLPRSPRDRLRAW